MLTAPCCAVPPWGCRHAPKPPKPPKRSRAQSQRAYRAGRGKPQHLDSWPLPQPSFDDLTVACESSPCAATAALPFAARVEVGRSWGEPYPTAERSRFPDMGMASARMGFRNLADGANGRAAKWLASICRGLRPALPSFADSLARPCSARSSQRSAARISRWRSSSASSASTTRASRSYWRRCRSTASR